MPLEDAGMHRLGLAFLYRTIPVILVSILFGIYITLLILATHALVERGLKNRANAAILVILYVVFLVSSALWSLELAQLLGLNSVTLLHSNGRTGDALFNRFYDLIARETKVTGVLFECQMILGDILVIWRASAIWFDRPIVVILPLFWWVLMIIDMLVGASFCESGVATTNYGKLCKVTNVLAPVLSIMVNVSVMLLTLLKAWQLRSILSDALRRKNTKLLSLFTLLIESGTLYSVMLITDLLITSYIAGGNETIQRLISCVSGYSTVQFVGIYPTLMIVMLRRSVWNISNEQHSLPPTRGGVLTSTITGIRFAEQSHRTDVLSMEILDRSGNSDLSGDIRLPRGIEKGEETSHSSFAINNALETRWHAV